MVRTSDSEVMRASNPYLPRGLLSLFLLLSLRFLIVGLGIIFDTN